MRRILWEDAWVLLAVRIAQGDRSRASRDEVVRAGDFVNHALLLDRELEHAAGVLGEAGLLCTDANGFRLGPAFADLWARSGAEKHRAVHRQLAKLGKALGVSDDPARVRRG